MSPYPGLLPVGHRVHTLTLRPTGTRENEDGITMRDFVVAPVLTRVKEIRIGRFDPDSGFDEHYGPLCDAPTSITYLVEPEGVILEPSKCVFSPDGNQLLGHGEIAGVPRRAYLSELQLRRYALEIQRAALETIHGVGIVTISPDVP